MLHLLLNGNVFAETQELYWLQCTANQNKCIYPEAQIFQPKNQCIYTQANKITCETKCSYYNQYISPGMYVTLLKPTWSHWNSKLKLFKRLKREEKKKKQTKKLQPVLQPLLCIRKHGIFFHHHSNLIHLVQFNAASTIPCPCPKDILDCRNLILVRQ